MNLLMIDRWFARWHAPWWTWVYLNLIGILLVAAALTPVDAVFGAVHKFCREVRACVRVARDSVTTAGRLKVLRGY